ncbi:hypothetical protein K2P47_00655 [Patescibacteria group bacterium]|nr:hypothetical protein [Patescibacteria group bacterium]
MVLKGQLMLISNTNSRLDILATDDMDYALSRIPAEIEFCKKHRPPETEVEVVIVERRRHFSFRGILGDCTGEEIVAHLKERIGK